MKFRTISRLIYLKRARHRRGHGIHSPFLFHLITAVIEDRHRLPEYKILKGLKNNVLNLLDDFRKPLLTEVYPQFKLSSSKSGKLYKKVELPIRYGKIVFRLIRYFKPSSIINYGPTFGVNLALMAMANNDSIVYQLINNSACEVLCKELLKDSAFSNIQFLPENSVPEVNPEFIMINFSDNPDMSRSVVQKYLRLHGDDDVLIIRGIHESQEMETIWLEMIASESVRVSLDLFEIGIALFRKELQKENFIHRF
ncbi:MAG: hypothetical protein NTY07_05705 [Bacteroidia bacterium]|nr:hypothetical protein [Bacteroidia bacterium]